MSDETIVGIAFFALIGVLFISYTAYQMSVRHLGDRWLLAKPVEKTSGR